MKAKVLQAALLMLLLILSPGCLFRTIGPTLSFPVFVYETRDGSWRNSPASLYEEDPIEIAFAPNIRGSADLAIRNLYYYSFDSRELFSVDTLVRTYTIEHSTISVMRDSSGTWENAESVRFYDTPPLAKQRERIVCSRDTVPDPFPTEPVLRHQFQPFNSVRDLQFRIELTLRRPDGSKQHIQRTLHVKRYDFHELKDFAIQSEYHLR